MPEQDTANFNAVVTSITPQVNDSNRVSVHVSSTYAFSLTLDQLLESKLRKGVELTPEQIEDYKKLSQDGKVRSRALEWTMNRPRARRELKDYLKRKGASEVLVQQLLEEFEQKKYIDDERYALWLRDVRLRQNKSQRAIHAELISKGVSQEIIREIQKEDGSGASDDVTLRALIKKLQSRSRYADEKKLITYLLSKGFSYNDISQALKEGDDA